MTRTEVIRVMRKVIDNLRRSGWTDEDLRVEITVVDLLEADGRALAIYSPHSIEQARQDAAAAERARMGAATN